VKLIESAPPIAWAVFLGCSTPCRLAAEWRIPKGTAATLLVRASRSGWVRRFRRGQYRVDPHWMRGDAEEWRRQRQLDYYHQRGAERRRQRMARTINQGTP